MPNGERLTAALNALWHMVPMQDGKGYAIQAVQWIENQCGGHTDDVVAVVPHYETAKRMVKDHNEAMR